MPVGNVIHTLSIRGEYAVLLSTVKCNSILRQWMFILTGVWHGVPIWEMLVNIYSPEFVAGAQNSTPARARGLHCLPGVGRVWCALPKGLVCLVCPPQASGIPSPGVEGLVCSTGRSGVPSPGESLVCLLWRGGSGVPSPPNVFFFNCM